MKPADIKGKTASELQKLVIQIEEELFQLRFKKSSGQLKQTSELRKKRKDLARVKTFLKQQELASV